MFQKQTSTWYIHLLSLVLFCYLLSRAALCGITYDEAWTLTSFVPSSLQDIITFENCDANNHLLNTLSIKLLSSILPDTLFVARLPSLVGGLLYLSYAGRFSQRHSPVTSLMCFTLLSLNPFVLEFFSLARGYGLGLGMLTAGLFHGLLFYEQRSNKQLFLSQLFLSVAITAALSYLHLYLATQVLLFIILLRGERKKLLSGLLIQAGIAIAAGLLLYGPIQKLRANDNLYYGGHTGIYEDSLLSLSSYFSGGPPAGSEVRIFLNTFLILVFFLFVNILRRREKKTSWPFIFSDTSWPFFFFNFRAVSLNEHPVCNGPDCALSVSASYFIFRRISRVPSSARLAKLFKCCADTIGFLQLFKFGECIQNEYLVF